MKSPQPCKGQVIAFHHGIQPTIVGVWGINEWDISWLNRVLHGLREIFMGWDYDRILATGMFLFSISFHFSKSPSEMFNLCISETQIAHDSPKFRCLTLEST